MQDYFEMDLKKKHHTYMSIYDIFGIYKYKWQFD